MFYLTILPGLMTSRAKDSGTILLLGFIFLSPHSLWVPFILFNSKLRGKIKATRGLFQGDPLSLFLFILVVDCLSRMLDQDAKKGIIEGFDVGNGALSINHLQSADDTILFSSPGKEKLSSLFESISSFDAASGLHINHMK